MNHHMTARAHLLPAMVAAIFAAHGPPTLGAQSPAMARDARPTIGLGELQRELERRSPRIAAASALSTATDARVPGAGLPPDPQLQLGWMNYALPSLAPMEPLGMMQLQLMQMVPLGGKLRLARGIAEARAEAQAERAAEVRWEQRALLAMAFYDLYQSNRALGVMRETLRLLQDARRAAESMYRVGEGRQSDVLRAQVEIARMTEDTLRMVAMSRTMAARLDALLDRAADPAAGVPVLPPFPGLPDADSLEQVALARRPMLRAGAQEVAGAERMQRLARKELLPDLTVGVQYGQRGTAAGDGAMGAEAGRRTERMGSLMLGATLPVFAGRRQLRARDEALALRAMAEADLRAMRSDTRGRIREGVATLERARRLQALYRGTVLPQADASAHSALAAYRGGQVDFMALLDARMTVNRYRLELHALEAEEGKAWAELEMLTGVELVDADARREEDP